jgi:hypothetical protein
MEINSLGELMAVRTLELFSPDGAEIGAVIIKIGKPVDIEVGTSYCPYQISGIGEERLHYGLGGDGVQALIIALTKIGTDLYTSAEWQTGRLTWMGDTSGNLGMPVIAEAFSEVVPAVSMNLTI